MIKYLLDECISIHEKEYFIQGSKNIHSVSVVGAGAKDPQVLQYAKDNKLILITADKKFVVNALAENVVVIYKCDKTKKEIMLRPKNYDMVTRHIKRKCEVIRP